VPELKREENERKDSGKGKGPTAFRALRWCGVHKDLGRSVTLKEGTMRGNYAEGKAAGPLRPGANFHAGGELPPKKKTAPLSNHSKMCRVPQDGFLLGAQCRQAYMLRLPNGKKKKKESQGTRVERAPRRGINSKRDGGLKGWKFAIVGVSAQRLPTSTGQ